MAYEFNLESPTEGYVMNSETKDIVCLVETKRPDLYFDKLEELIEKANKYDDLCK